MAADDSLYVLVETSGHESQATSTFQAWGVNMDHVRFIRAATYSHWTRDWGPHGVFDGEGDFGITDPVFDGYPWVPGCNIDPGNGASNGTNRSTDRGTDRQHRPRHQRWRRRCRATARHGEFSRRAGLRGG